MSDQNKIFCGDAKKIEFQNGGSITAATINLDQLEQYFQQYGFTTKAGARKIKIKISRKRQTDQYGNTHFVEIDTWSPNQNNNQGGAPQQSYQNNGGQQQGYRQPPQQQSGGYGSYQPPPIGGPGSFEDDIPF